MTKAEAIQHVTEVINSLPDTDAISIWFENGIDRQPSPDTVVKLRASYNGTRTISVFVNGGAMDSGESPYLEYARSESASGDEE